MTVIFYYDLSTFLMKIIFYDLFLLIGFCFLIKSGRNQVESIKGSNLLILIGLINIFTVVIIRFLFIKLFANLVYLFTLGVISFIFGYINRKSFQNYLSKAGLLMIINYTLFIIQLNTYAFFIFNDDIIFQNNSIENCPICVLNIILHNISLPIYMVSFGFFLVHSKINKDKNYRYSIIFILISYINGFMIEGILLPLTSS